MKIELVKKTTKLTGNVYYYITVDGIGLISETWTSDLEKAQEYLKETCIKAKAFPEDKIEVLATEIIEDSNK